MRERSAGGPVCGGVPLLTGLRGVSLDRQPDAAELITPADGYSHRPWHMGSMRLHHGRVLRTGHGATAHRWYRGAQTQNGSVQVPVFVESWQHECCGTTSAVGSRVSWRLGTDQEGFLARALGEQAPSWSAYLPVINKLNGGDGEPEDLIVGLTGLHVFVRADGGQVPTQQGVMVLGPLLEDHHVGVPPEVTPTQGVVRRVRTVHQGYQDSMPRAGDAVLHDVTQAQRWSNDAEQDRMFTGFLIDLEVDE